MNTLQHDRMEIPVSREQVNTEIRIAVPDDAAAIVELLRRSFIEYKSLYSSKGFLATTPGITEIVDRISKKAVWIALHNNAVAGTVSIFPSGEGYHIRSMAVAPLARGKGVGRTLMLHAQKLALSNRASFLKLNTTPFLKEAIRLYENFGFKQDGFDDLYGTPLIRMIKNLEYITQNKIVKNDHAK